MRKVLSILALMVAMLAGGAGMAHAAELPPCEFEDSTNCYWDAAERGNGTGDSFTDIDGVAHYWGADLAAWELWDSVGAAELLPEEYVTVTFAGAYDGHALTVAEVAVWDGQGNAYLFLIS